MLHATEIVKYVYQVELNVLVWIGCFKRQDDIVTSSSLATDQNQRILACGASALDEGRGRETPGGLEAIASNFFEGIVGLGYLIYLIPNYLDYDPCSAKSMHM